MNSKTDRLTKVQRATVAIFFLTAVAVAAYMGWMTAQSLTNALHL